MVRKSYDVQENVFTVDGTPSVQFNAKHARTTNNTKSKRN